MAMLKTVIHVHTSYSRDSNLSCEQLIAMARRKRVDCIAVTDHNTIAGALRAREIGGVQIIVGEEISSADGHVVGLFLEERIPPRLPAVETARRIRAQGGLVLAPHPFASLCHASLGRDALERLLPWLDAVEVCNAQNPLFWEDRWARRFCRRHQVTPYVGADTHLRGYLDGCYQLLRPFSSPASFLGALRTATLVPGHFGLLYVAKMSGRHWLRKLLGQRARRGTGSVSVAADVSPVVPSTRCPLHAEQR